MQVAATSARLRVESGGLEYGSSDLSLVARQHEHRYWVLTALCGPDNAYARQDVAERQGAIMQRLREVNARAETEALEAHFAKYKVRVAPYDPASPAIEPRCFYAHTFLEWGRLKTHRYWESTRLLGAAIKYLWERPSGGAIALADVERLADS